MQCRSGCGACCIAPSISSPLPDLPQGKPADVICPHLDENYLCRLFGLSSRPAVCSRLKPCVDMCGENRQQALVYLAQLELDTAP